MSCHERRVIASVVQSGSIPFDTPRTLEKLASLAAAARAAGAQLAVFPEAYVGGYPKGQGLTVVDTPHGKVGAVICWENYMPLLRTAMYAKGIENIDCGCRIGND